MKRMVLLILLVLNLLFPFKVFSAVVNELPECPKLNFKKGNWVAWLDDNVQLVAEPVAYNSKKFLKYNGIRITVSTDNIYLEIWNPEIPVLRIKDINMYIYDMPVGVPQSSIFDESAIISFTSSEEFKRFINSSGVLIKVNMQKNFSAEETISDQIQIDMTGLKKASEDVMEFIDKVHEDGKCKFKGDEGGGGGDEYD